MGGFSPEMLPGALHARPQLRRLRRLALRRAVADLLQPLVLPRLDLARLRHQQGAAAATASGSTPRPTPTIFNRLEDAGIDWRIYFDDLQLVSLHRRAARAGAGEVLEDRALRDRWSSSTPMSPTGKLPAYSFIEPRMVYNHNDFHPPVGALRESDVDGEPVIDSAVSDVRAGEALVHQIYDGRAHQCERRRGSNALNTMLLITFDEHGGTYDHVPPPAAVTAATRHAAPGEMGFAFDRLGCRVPAIAISAWTRGPARVINDEMHHGSLIATLSQAARAEAADRARRRRERHSSTPSTCSTPRDPSTWPTTTPAVHARRTREAGAASGADADQDQAAEPARRADSLGLLLAKYGAAGTPMPETYGEAFDLLQKYGTGLFGVPR